MSNNSFLRAEQHLGVPTCSACLASEVSCISQPGCPPRTQWTCLSSLRFVSAATALAKALKANVANSRLRFFDTEAPEGARVVPLGGEVIEAFDAAAAAWAAHGRSVQLRVNAGERNISWSWPE